MRVSKTKTTSAYAQEAFLRMGRAKQMLEKQMKERALRAESDLVLH
jgi:hypothetical protein